MTENPECWQDLANAVILQAIEDYRAACVKLRGRPRLREQLAVKRSVERFFTSSWFRTLSSLDGQRLLEEIRKEVSP